MTRVLIADDHPLILEGLAALVAGTPFEVTVRCGSGAEVLAAVEDRAADLFVLDLQMPPPDGLELLRSLAGRGLVGRAVLLTSSLPPDTLSEALALGVGGVVLKESAARLLLRCLETVARGETWIDPELTRRLVQRVAPDDRPAHGLTGREIDVLRLAAEGRRNKEIAAALGLTEGTVKMYLHGVYGKLAVSNRTGMVAAARRHGLL